MTAVYDWGWIWLLVALVIVALGIGMAYGVLRNRRRDPDLDRRSEAATRELYERIDRGPQR